MNLTGWQQENDDDDGVFPIHQQPAQQNRPGVQTMDDVQNQQHGRSLFMQPGPQTLNVPHNNPMISPDAGWPSSSNVAAFAGASNTTGPTLLQGVYQAPAARGARAASPAPHAVYAPPAPGLRPPVYQQQQQPMAPLYDFGDMVAPPAAVPLPIPTMAATSGHQPQFTLNHHHQQQQEEEMFAPRRQGGWMGSRRRRETGPIMLSFQQPQAADPFTPMAGSGPFTPMAAGQAGSGTAFGASSPTGATDAGAYGAAAVAQAQLQSPNAGAQPADSSFDDVLRAMMEMDYYANNCSAEALMAPATDELAGMQAAAALGSSGNYNAGPFMVTDANGGNGTPFMALALAPQDPAAPTGNQNQVQVELGAPDIYGGSLLVGSHQGGGTSAMFNGDGDMAPMFPSNEYGATANAMFSLDALLDFDDGVPTYPEGHQVAAADSTTASNATGIMSNGGESGGSGPSWNMGAAAADEGLDMLEEFLMEDNESGFLLPQDMNNGLQ
ncbi:hypothetical protein ZEAMMB73_Zm00001d032057 [Zea mays]|nr:hypothetical protein ZEAMMB73_Zm00001d032057 [Zea mays]